MPRRSDLETILIIGAGPIVIGQACEFDYSGVQACKALRDEGYRIVLINSNPATIMTDPDLADRTYVEPITPDFVAKIIEREKPDALLPTMGGQTALNTALALEADGTLEAHGVELIGARREAIEMAEDREKFRTAMVRIGLDVPRSRVARSMEEAQDIVADIGLPCVIRPSFTLGGSGGGMAFTPEEFTAIVEQGLQASPSTEVLIEQSIRGWKEFEMEVVRDRADNAIIVCSIENVDPMGVHTGDSITVAPALTLTDKEYQRMRNAAIAVLREIGVETGGSNVQFAVDPADGRLVVIEMNPRVSRSSALASKATGFPIAKVAAKLAVGYTLDELANDITGVTPASFEPTIDYVVTKIPRFAFDKFPGAEAVLGTAMKSVGEAMAIGRTFQESVQKALRSLETGLAGFDERHTGDDNALREALVHQTPDRLLLVADAFRAGLSLEEVKSLTGFDPWFLHQIIEIVDTEDHLKAHGLPTDAEAVRALKAMGFSDARLARVTGARTEDVAAHRQALHVRPIYKRIDTCAAEFEARTPYMYSTYETPIFGGVPECEAQPSDAMKVAILGGGPNRIGQGIEFDYCCCHAAFAMADLGLESIMINCNPETVSTDYDTSDRLYFEPLTDEDVIEILTLERTRGTLKGVIVQFGGQTPLKLTRALARADIPILGTPADAIDRAEDRGRFMDLINGLGLKQPDCRTAGSREDMVRLAREVGYPVVVRPSNVLGGRAMEIVLDDDHLQRTRIMGPDFDFGSEGPVLVDAYLNDAIEVDADALCDGQSVIVAGILEHIEEAGVHSGDSACTLPPYSLPQAMVDRLSEQTRALALELGVIGLMNVQYAIKDDEIHVLEVNPRASRTVPFVAKAIGSPLANIAARLMVGHTLEDTYREPLRRDHMAVKESCFPFTKFPGVDTILGPEMRSTGEVMGVDTDFGRAFAKSQIAGGTGLPLEGTAFVSVRDGDKPGVVDTVQALIDMGFDVMATAGTARHLGEQGLAVRVVNKVAEGSPHIVDALNAGEVQLVINTTDGSMAISDSKSIRRTALMLHIPYYTTIAGGRAAVRAIRSLRAGSLEVAPLQFYAEKPTSPQ
ncbi:MAG: carbamoyl-phosphate synthase large subunit [Alphaproteobacteria bacterium]